jgi:phosphoinositide-3-kinase regulatory subunit 4
MDLFLALCPHLTDEAKLDRMLPYVVDLLHDDSSNVRAAALRTMIQIVSHHQVGLVVVSQQL